MSKRPYAPPCTSNVGVTKVTLRRVSLWLLGALAVPCSAGQAGQAIEVIDDEFQSGKIVRSSLREFAPRHKYRLEVQVGAGRRTETSILIVVDQIRTIGLDSGVVVAVSFLKGLAPKWDMRRDDRGCSPQSCGSRDFVLITLRPTDLAGGAVSGGMLPIKVTSSSGVSEVARIPLSDIREVQARAR